MLFFIFVIITVLLLTAYFIIDRNSVRETWSGEDKRTKFQKFCYKLNISTPVNVFYMVALTISIIGLAISLIVLSFNYIGASSYKASLLEEQRILTYQIENKFYENDIEYGKNELFRDVTEFNKQIRKHRELTKDFWVGIYEPNIYDDIPLVELPIVEAS